MIMTITYSPDLERQNLKVGNNAIHNILEITSTSSSAFRELLLVNEMMHAFLIVEGSDNHGRCLRNRVPFSSGAFFWCRWFGGPPHIQCPPWLAFSVDQLDKQATWH